MEKLTGAALLSGLLLAQIPVLAQGSAASGSAGIGRPYRGLFEGNDPPKGPQSLMFETSVFGGYDTNVISGLRGGRGSGPSNGQQKGSYAGADLLLNYTLAPTQGKVTFEATSVALGRFYYVDKWDFLPHYQGGVSVGVPLAASTRFNAGYTVSVSRYYRFLMFPDPAGGINEAGGVDTQELDMFARSNARHSAVISLSHKLAKHSTLTAAYRAHYVQFFNTDSDPFRRLSASITFDHQLTSHATLNLGYIHTTVDRGVLPDEGVLQTINAGVSYSRALSFSRRTSLSFSTGSAYLRGVAGTARDRFHLTGSVALRHEMGRTWTGELAYHRAVVLREAFTAPFLTDGLMASIHGTVSRRMDASAMASWSFSKYQGESGGHHRGAWAVAQTTYALSRPLALYARYVYYNSFFSDEVPLVPGIPETLDRQGVRVGLTLAVPLIR